MSDHNNRIKYLHGPQSLQTSDTDVVIICMVKNADEYVKEFIEHHFDKGVKHIVFVDNGSSDDTTNIACKYDSVTIYECDLPYITYKSKVVHHIIDQFSSNCWTMALDIDEFFDYPYSEFLTLSMFVSYLESQNYSAVICQMLDMFSENINLKSHDDRKLHFRKTFKHYDLSDITGHAFQTEANDNIYNNPNIKFYKGGFRKTIFQLDDIWLSKMSLFRFSKIDSFSHDHYVTGAKLADISCALYHYKFRSDFIQYCETIIKEKPFVNVKEYKQYLKFSHANESLTYKSKYTQELTDTFQLVNDNFLTISNSFVSFVHDKLEELKHSNKIPYIDYSGLQGQLLNQTLALNIDLEKKYRDASNFTIQNFSDKMNVVLKSRTWKFVVYLLKQKKMVERLVNKVLRRQSKND